MREIELSIDNGQINICGISDAHSILKLPVELAKNLTDLSLHKCDLNISLESLDYIYAHPELKDSLVNESIWRSAIIHFIKCFTDQVKKSPYWSRQKMMKEDVFTKHSNALAAFEYFYALRNKHIVHDENPFIQSIPCVILNNGEKEKLVEDVICLDIRSSTSEDSNYNNLYNLVKVALDYVVEQFDFETERLKEKLNSLDFKEFTEMESMKFTVPSLDDLKKARK